MCVGVVFFFPLFLLGGGRAAHRMWEVYVLWKVLFHNRTCADLDAKFKGDMAVNVGVDDSDTGGCLRQRNRRC